MKRDMPNTPYNILWFTSDMQRFDTIHCLNNPHIHTPNLDRLCADGVAFTHTYCQNVICIPSRSSFLTGRYPSSIRACMSGNETFSDAAPLIPKLLADHGYVCGLSGKLHIASPWLGPEKRVEDGYSFFRYSHSPFARLDQGNDYMQWLLDKGIDPASVFERKPPGADTEFGGYKPSITPEIHQTTWCTDEAIRFITENRDRPWLMSVNVLDPHGPLDPPPEYKERYEVKDMPEPHFRESDLEHEERLSEIDFIDKARRIDELENKERTAAYFAMIELVDHNVGRLLKLLEETGQRDNTLVVFMSDHGEISGDHGLTKTGCRFYEGLVRVPLIMSLPGRFHAGLRSDALVELIDVAPTILELAGVPLPERMEGRSLLPILEGEKSPDHHRDHVRCEYYNTIDLIGYDIEFAGSYGTMIRERRYKCAVYHGHDYGELYDLESDPWEHHNLWESAGHLPIRERLIRKAFDSLAFSIDLGPRRIGRY